MKMTRTIFYFFLVLWVKNSYASRVTLDSNETLLDEYDDVLDLKYDDVLDLKASQATWLDNHVLTFGSAGQNQTWHILDWSPRLKEAVSRDNVRNFIRSSRTAQFIVWATDEVAGYADKIAGYDCKNSWRTAYVGANEPDCRRMCDLIDASVDVKKKIETIKDELARVVVLQIKMAYVDTMKREELYPFDGIVACGIPSPLREKCGQTGITEDQCEAKGCCYQSNEQDMQQNAPSCYYSTASRKPDIPPRENEGQGHCSGARRSQVLQVHNSDECKQMCQDGELDGAKCKASGVDFQEIVCLNADRAFGQSPAMTSLKVLQIDGGKDECWQACQDTIECTSFVFEQAGFCELLGGYCHKPVPFRKGGAQRQSSNELWCQKDGYDGYASISDHECGYDGISSGECENMGCCYQQSGRWEGRCLHNFRVGADLLDNDLETDENGIEQELFVKGAHGPGDDPSTTFRGEDAQGEASACNLRWVFIKMVNGKPMYQPHDEAKRTDNFRIMYQNHVNEHSVEAFEPKAHPKWVIICDGKYRYYQSTALSSPPRQGWEPTDDASGTVIIEGTPPRIPNRLVLNGAPKCNGFFKRERSKATHVQSGRPVWKMEDTDGWTGEISFFTPAKKESQQANDRAQSGGWKITCIRKEGRTVEDYSLWNQKTASEVYPPPEGWTDYVQGFDGSYSVSLEIAQKRKFSIMRTCALWYHKCSFTPAFEGMVVTEFFFYADETRLMLQAEAEKTKDLMERSPTSVRNDLDNAQAEAKRLKDELDQNGCALAVAVVNEAKEGARKQFKEAYEWYESQRCNLIKYTFLGLAMATDKLVGLVATWGASEVYQQTNPLCSDVVFFSREWFKEQAKGLLVSFAKWMCGMMGDKFYGPLLKMFRDATQIDKAAPSTGKDIATAGWMVADWLASDGVCAIVELAFDWMDAVIKMTCGKFTEAVLTVVYPIIECFIHAKGHERKPCKDKPCLLGHR